MSKIRTQFNELKIKSAEELKELLSYEREALRALNFKVHTQELKQVHLVKATRMRIAQILTLLNKKAE